jgi:hypothetical protein
VEFVYWGESSLDYEKIIWYIVAGAAGFGTLICLCAAGVFYTSLGEKLDASASQMWLFKGKSKKYFDEQAPSVVPMVIEASEFAVAKGQWRESQIGKIKRTRKETIRLQKNGLVEPWCFMEGLAPIQNIYLAYFLYFLNIFVPGFGSFCSACCGEPIELNKIEEPEPVPVKKSKRSGSDTEENDESENLSEEPDSDEEAKKPEPSLHPTLPPQSLQRPKPVINLDKVPQFSPFQALFTGIMQLLTCACGLGWIWSISHGRALVENAEIYEEINRLRALPDSEFIPEREY